MSLTRSARRRELDYKGQHRPVGLIDWKPTHQSTKDRLAAVLGVLDDYKAQWPLTVRQIMYRLVATGHEKKTGAEGRVEYITTLGRRSGLIPWEAIRDDSATRRVIGEGYAALGDYLDGLTTDHPFWRDKFEGQGRDVWIWTEARGMTPAVGAALSGLPVQIRSGGGQNSVTLIHETAGWIRRNGRPVTMFYLGDFDRHGVEIEDRLASDLGAFLGTPEDPEIRFVPLILTPEQIEEHQLPSEEGKPDSWQAEAFPPDLFAKTIREAVEAELDLDRIQQIKDEQTTARVELDEAIDERREAA